MADDEPIYPVPKPRNKLSVQSTITEYDLGEVRAPVKRKRMSIPTRKLPGNEDHSPDKSECSSQEEADQSLDRSGSTRSSICSKPVECDIQECDENVISHPSIPSRSTALPARSPKGVFGTDKIQLLHADTYDEFISDKQKVLIIFYEFRTPEFAKLATEFGFTAATSKNKRHAFAAVDCELDPTLCCREKVMNVSAPSLKLLSNGFEVSIIQDASKFTNNQMKLLVELTPILTQPRGK